MKLKGSVAVVTGVSHDNGIGAAVCRKFAEAGADIFFTQWEANGDWVESFQEELIQNHGIKCQHLSIDLSDADAPFTILDAATDKLGTPTILVNNAAHSTQDGYLKLDAETLDNHYAVNMRATFLLCVEFARKFRNQNKQSGRIINMTSGQDLGPMIGELAYVSTKGAVSSFTQSLSAEVAPLGITVNAVNPGPTDTGWMTDEIKTHLEDKFLAGRMGMPVDAARLIAFLASEDAAWITGQIINSEGGFLRN